MDPRVPAGVGGRVAGPARAGDSSPTCQVPSAPAPPAAAARPGRRLAISLSFELPRDPRSVPIARRLVGTALEELGVDAEDVADAKLAISEACANVVTHSGPGDAYEVYVALEPGYCHIRVFDIGRGFDHSALTPPEMAKVDAEHGRGVALMHALVDQVRFESQPEFGTIVHLVKRLRLAER